MKNIVIVEDKLGRGVSLAQQFAEYAKNYPELNIQVAGICYFCPDREKANRDIDLTKSEFDITNVTLLNFTETMDRYLDCANGDQTFIIMDYMLDGDGSEGIPTRRVNIRYARYQERYKSKEIWFYTGTGRINEKILIDLFGQERVLMVKELDDYRDYIRLDLDNKYFTRELRAGQLVRV